MWHKCKNGTLVNLDQAMSVEILTAKDTGKFLLFLYLVRQVQQLCVGTREECEAEMAEIEAKIMAWEKPMLLTEKGVTR